MVREVRSAARVKAVAGGDRVARVVDPMRAATATIRPVADGNPMLRPKGKGRPEAGDGAQQQSSAKRCRALPRAAHKRFLRRFSFADRAARTIVRAASRESGSRQMTSLNIPKQIFTIGTYCRTLFLEFDSKDWEEELEDFHGTDVDVPAKLTVDGKTYDNVGIRFRGTSSYGGVPRGQKRSMNVTMDLVDKKQNLHGYKTLNLLNSHEDPSFLRTVLYDYIARHYIPAPEANLVRVVINGESWGIYSNEEQFNNDFTKKWFGDGTGPRWKVPPNFSGAAALVYHGDNPDDYRNLYEIKAKDEKQAWHDLIDLCKKLQDTPDDRLEEELSKVLDLDRALWFLALDNVFIDDDGYYSRGSDYCIYQDPKTKRFHLLPRDSNETFRYPGGPGFGGPGGGPGFAGPGGGPGGGGGPTNGDARRGGDAPGGLARGAGGPGGSGGGARGATQDPLAQLEANNRPLIHRLLSNKIFVPATWLMCGPSSTSGCVGKQLSRSSRIIERRSSTT